MSSIIGWIGIAIALRNRVRILVMPNLYRICNGGFAYPKTLGPGRYGTNPETDVIGVFPASKC